MKPYKHKTHSKKYTAIKYVFDILTKKNLE